MNVPANLRYSTSDEWVKQDGDVVTIGITDYAQNELGEIVYVELPDVGSTITAETPFGVVESVKAVSELLAPVSGEVVEANLALSDEPAQINASPYEGAWMVKVRLSDTSTLESLMDAAAYTAYRAGSGH